MDERRRFPRVDSSFNVTVIPIGDDGAVNNISQGGISYVTSQPIAEGKIISLDLNIPGLTGDVIVRGQVRHCKKLDNGKYSIGVQFADVDSETEKFIYEYIDSAMAL